MDDLSLIRGVLKALYEEVHHPGYFRDLDLNVDAAFDKALAAWDRVNNKDIDREGSLEEDRGANRRKTMRVAPIANTMQPGGRVTTGGEAPSFGPVRSPQ